MADNEQITDAQEEQNQVENPFISNEPVEKEIGGGKFKFRELKGSEHDEMRSRNIKVENEQVVGMDVAAKHEYLLTRSVVDAPDNIELNDTHYSKLGKEDKKKVWDKIRPSLREKVLEAALQVNGLGEEEAKK